MDSPENQVELTGPAGIGASIRGGNNYVVIILFSAVVLISLGGYREITIMHAEIAELSARLTECEEALKILIGKLAGA